MKVTIIFSLHQWFFWPSLVVIEHCLTFLTPTVQGTSMYHAQNSACTPSALALPTYQISSEWSVRFPRNAPDNFLHKICKLATKLACALPKFQYAQLSPNPTHILNIIKVGHTFPEKCSGQTNTDGRRWTDIWITKSLPGVSSWTKFKRDKKGRKEESKNSKFKQHPLLAMLRSSTCQRPCTCVDACTVGFCYRKYDLV